MYKKITMVVATMFAIAAIAGAATLVTGTAHAQIQIGGSGQGGNGQGGSGVGGSSVFGTGGQGGGNGQGGTGVGGSIYNYP